MVAGPAASRAIAGSMLDQSPQCGATVGTRPAARNCAVARMRLATATMSLAPRGDRYTVLRQLAYKKALNQTSQLDHLFPVTANRLGDDPLRMRSGFRSGQTIE